MMLETIKRMLRKNRFTASIVELYFLKQKYLTESGWLESRFQSKPMDVNRKPIPWISYSAIYYLDQVLTKDLNMFEYGSGHSTIWFSERVNFVDSIEHHKEYFDYIKSKLSNITNVDYRYADLSGDYINTIGKRGKKYDVIVIDGRNRVECSYKAIEYLTDIGVIIWDNSERERYKPGIDYLIQKNGFKKIDFMSHGPIGHSQSCTTVFYRQKNCLGI